MNEIECESCIKRKTIYCPSSSECYDTVDKPYYQNRIMLLKENQQLREQINMYLNNEYKLKDRLEKQRKEYQETYKDVRIEIKELKEKLEASEKARKEAIDYINFLVIIDTQLAGGCFKNTIWGKELLDILDIDKEEWK